MIKDSDRKWAKTKLADAASEIFKTLVVTREIPAVDAADLLSYEWGSTPEGTLVSRVFRAMIGARKRKKP